MQAARPYVLDQSDREQGGRKNERLGWRAHKNLAYQKGSGNKDCARMQLATRQSHHRKPRDEGDRPDDGAGEEDGRTGRCHALAATKPMPCGKAMSERRAQTHVESHQLGHVRKVV